MTLKVFKYKRANLFVIRSEKQHRSGVTFDAMNMRNCCNLDGLLKSRIEYQLERGTSMIRGSRLENKNKKGAIFVDGWKNQHRNYISEESK